jgi:PDZ domain-containing secreted protein
MTRTLVAIILAILFTTNQLNAQEKLESSTDLFEGILNSLSEQGENLKLSANDYKRIKRKNNTFYIPYELKAKALFSMAEISKQAVVRKVTLNKQPIGFRIEQLSNQSVFKNLGLETGDIIQSVNGHNLTSEENSLDLIKQLDQESVFKLALLRGSKRISHSFTYILTS